MSNNNNDGSMNQQDNHGIDQAYIDGSQASIDDPASKRKSHSDNQEKVHMQEMDKNNLDAVDAMN